MFDLSDLSDDISDISTRAEFLRDTSLPRPRSSSRAASSDRPPTIGCPGFS
jgi:hypothetical protein